MIAAGGAVAVSLTLKSPKMGATDTATTGGGENAGFRAITGKTAHTIARGCNPAGRLDIRAGENKASTTPLRLANINPWRHRYMRGNLTDLLRRELRRAGSLNRTAIASGVTCASLSKFVRGKQSLRLDFADKASLINKGSK